MAMTASNGHRFNSEGSYKLATAPFSATLALSLSSLTWLPALAADSASTGERPKELPTVTVQESQQSTGGAMLKLKLAPREIPQSISTIDQQRMQEQNLFSMDEVMAQATGVTTRPYELLTTAFYVRGFKINSFEMDGVSAQLGGTASSPQDMAVYERVEILRGANGLMHGAGNPSATVNLVRKRPQRAFTKSVSLSAGSWNRLRGELDVGGPLTADGRVRGRMVAAYEDRDYFYRVAEQKTKLLYGIAEVDLTPQTLLTVGAQYQNIDSVTNMAGVPMAKDGSSLGLSRKTYLDVAWDKFDWETKRAFGSLEQRLESGWTAKLNADYQTADSHLRYAGSYGAIDPATGDGGRLNVGAYRFESSQRSLDASIGGPVKGWGLRHELLFGANYSRGETEQFQAMPRTAVNVPVNVYRWNPWSVPLPQFGDYQSPGSTTTTQKSLYGMGRIKLAEPLTLVLGGRTSWWEQKDPAKRFKPGQQWTPYGGVIWDFQPDWSWYASYAEVYQPQTMRTFSGDPLKPVEGRSYETGIKGDIAGGRMNLSLALFRVQLENNPQIDPEHPGVGPGAFYVSGGKVRSQGFELEATGRITPALSVAVGYTHTQTKYLRDTVARSGTQYSTYTPKHLLRVWSNYQLPWQERRWSIGAGLQMQSENHVNAGAVKLRQGGYATASLRLGYRVNKDWTASVSVNNVFDRIYYQNLFSPQWSNRYGEPRNVMVSLRGSF